MEAKWSRNGARGHLVECARTMVFTVREAYREVWGRLREPTFYKPRRLTLPGGASERILADMERFGGPHGCRLGIKMWTFFRLGNRVKIPENKQTFWSTLGRGRRQGRGLPEASESENLETDLTRPAPPSGVRRILRAAPSATGPL